MLQLSFSVSAYKEKERKDGLYVTQLRETLSFENNKNTETHDRLVSL